MPTARPRHVITETDDVARALDDAAARWPEDRDNRPRLLRRLLEEGHRAVSSDRDREKNQQREAINRTSGVLTGVYGADYLANLREDWPT